MQRFASYLIFCVYSLVLLWVGFTISNSGFLARIGLGAGAPVDVREEFQPFWDVWHIIHREYVDQPLDDTLLVEGAIEGMLASLDDRNTRYLSPVEQEADTERMSGEFQGIGATVESIDGKVTIVSPIEGSPAEAAGIEPGDILLAADGTSLVDMDINDAVQLVRGPAGSVVTLTIERDGEVFDLPVERGVITIESVRSEILEENIGYIRITQFGTDTAEDFETTLEEVLAQSPAGLIIDLRNNPGGLLDAVVSIADELLVDGVVLTQSFGNGDERIFRSDEDGVGETIPLTVLVNEGSASASEVLAGAVQDRDRGIVVGTQSFGKGTVQSIHLLSNQGGLRVTIARWLTPDGGFIHENGVTPDIIIEQPEELAEDEDPQLEAAVDALLGE